jgi:hypothetical protein
MFTKNIVLIHVEEINGDNVRLRFSLNNRGDIEKEVFSPEIFTLRTHDSRSVNNIIADYDPTRKLEEYL